MTNLYNDIQQKKIAWQLAQAELATEQQSMSATETKRGLGMVSDLEYLQAQSSFLGKQIAEKTANMALFQAVETYNWAVKRISESDTVIRGRIERKKRGFPAPPKA